MRALMTPSWLRRVAIVCVHIGLWTAAFALALQLRFDGTIPSPYLQRLPLALGVLVGCRIVVFYASGLFHGLWRYAGLPELRSLGFATTLGTVAFLGVGVMLPNTQMPRSIYVGEWLASVVLVGGIRFLIRTVRERRRGERNENAVRTLIVGAGEAGESLLRDLERVHDGRWTACGFLDDNPLKTGAIMRGVRVLGPANEATLRRVIEQNEIKLVVLAIPTANGTRIREIVTICRRLGVQAKTIPSLPDRVIGDLSFSAIREIAIDDLLRRDPVQLDTGQLAGLIEGRTLLVTGAGGSIGSELCRQALRFAPAKVLLFDHDENALFFMERELRQNFPDANIVPLIGDVTDRGRVDLVFKRYRPEVVLHAAAHKHVPMMEANACEAVKNNVLGSAVVADAAHTHGAEAFVLISTDKAVNPTSVMGASKRVAEMVIQARAQGSETRFVAVRFGNVLGSAGSVVPIFRDQIARGGPVLVTHRDMQRYFMTIPEAAQLVLQAGALGQGGEIFLLDMGKPVKIVDLARDLIELSGLVPDVDVAIQFTGLRPGEKLFEELLLKDEAFDRTTHPKIVIGKIQPVPREAFKKAFAGLEAAALLGDELTLRHLLAQAIPEATLGPEPRIPDAREAEPALPEQMQSA